MTSRTDCISFIIITLIGCHGFVTTSAADFYPYYAVPDVRITSTSSLLQSFTTVTSISCTSWCSVIPKCTFAQHFYKNNSCQLHQIQGFQSRNAKGNPVNVKLNLSVTEVDSIYQDLVDLLVLGGQTDGPGYYAHERTRSASQCQQLCAVMTCSHFAYNRIKKLCYVCATDFYNSWTNVTDSDPGWTSYYKKQPGSSKLLMKVSAGSGIDVSDFLYSPSQFTRTASAIQMSKDSTCMCNIKNLIFQYWTRFNLKKIHFTLATKGTISAFVTFNATGATPNDFFNLPRILNSSWTDLKATTTEAIHFRIGTPANNWPGRYFVIATAWCDCICDILWTATTGPYPPGCNFDKGRMPVFAYMPTSTRGNLELNGAFADAMLLYGEF